MTMNPIESSKRKTDYVISNYEAELQPELTQKSKEIVGVFKKVFDQLSNEFGLSEGKDIKRIKYYSFVDRVKETNSLREKIFRIDLLVSEFKDLKDNFKDTLQTKEMVNKMLLSLDDLIGVRIIVDLDSDCQQALNLIKHAQNSKFTTLDVEFIGDLDAQPQKMRNGLHIYKIKCLYRKKYHFELQIKSKLLNAWGDMEHSLFYKDYTVSPVKDSTQATMNHIGKLLYEIDATLLDIRRAEKHYSENAEFVGFLRALHENYASELATKFNTVSIRFEPIADSLFCIFQNTNSKSRHGFAGLRLAHFGMTAEMFPMKQYIELRMRSNNLMLFESIAIPWLLDAPPKRITSTNFVMQLNRFLHGYQECLAKKVLLVLPGMDMATIVDKVNHYFELALKYECNATFVLNTNEFVAFVRTAIIFIDPDEDDSKIRLHMLDAVYIHYHGGSCETYIEFVLESLGVEETSLALTAKSLRDSLPDIETEPFAAKVTSSINKVFKLGHQS